MFQSQEVVRINMPSGAQRKYPFFAKAFHGMKAKFSKPIVTNASKEAGLVFVNLAVAKNMKDEWLIVERNWLSKA